MSQKIAVITGATGALGGALARGLAARDPGQNNEKWHIVALGQNRKRLEQLDDDLKAAGATATLVPFDFRGDLAPLAQLGAQLHERFGKLDALIMAAAMLGPLTPLHHLDAATLARLLQVNATAHHALLRSLDPLLRKAADAEGKATAAFITCSLGADANAYWGGYRASKDALAALGRSYAAENETSTIKTILFEPDAFASNLRRDAFPGIAPEALKTAKAAAAPLLAQL